VTSATHHAKPEQPSNRSLNPDRLIVAGLERKPQRVKSQSGVSIVDDQPYTNSFADVHKKIKAIKDRIAAANKDDRKLRESKAVEESQRLRELADKEK